MILPPRHDRGDRLVAAVQSSKHSGGHAGKVRPQHRAAKRRANARARAAATLAARTQTAADRRHDAIIAELAAEAARATEVAAAAPLAAFAPLAAALADEPPAARVTAAGEDWPARRVLGQWGADR